MKKTLIVVDMQKDFIDGVLGTKEAVAIVDAVKEKIAMYRANGDEVIFTRDTHQSNYLCTNEGKYLPVCIAWKVQKAGRYGKVFMNREMKLLISLRLDFWAGINIPLKRWN